ncbi:hypothetical protein E1287_08865 [Actinomadura sp. KC06]|uniref:hypothetical protein n=1 Tax=Actinomadura sp. KC06 TaxID=2530369 RepID=UPI001051EB43|nr:hypothetical protein [Actinomadura sp. KC06]TDD37258.1 hypothetical protein E1287_08865 [Actinomadura sp. KC06]
MKSNQATISGGGAAGLGGTGLGTSGGQRLPSSPRERKPALAALALLLILGGALASAYLVMASGERVSAIRIAQPVAAGQAIPASALEEVQVGDTGIQYLDWTERAKVTRHIAAVPLVKGALLTNSMISPADAPSSGRLIVGLALKPGQFPSGGGDTGVSVGRHVMLYAVGGATNGGPRPGTVLSQDAIVVGMSGDDGGSGGLGGARLRSEQTNVDVAVPPADAALVTQAASAGTIAVALIPAGANAAPPPAAPAPGKPGDQQTPGPGATQNPGTTQNPGGTQSPGGTVPVPSGGGGAPDPGTGGN